ncbi:heme-binding protein 2-like [Branchiostoma lanceolatum]|uniref:heme-binding protein 2-like n=1 Tax=Branchiostoma lanceolatum TaxID=7740 RepID=UPI0034558086
MRTGYGKLIQYISGANKERANIPMTEPVVTMVTPGQNSSSSNFTVSLIVPRADQTSPLQPSDPLVYLNPFPKMTAYVRHFSGYAFGDDWAENAATLAGALDNATISYHKNFYYAAEYNSVFQPVFRHNEVWLIKSD